MLVDVDRNATSLGLSHNFILIRVSKNLAKYLRRKVTDCGYKYLTVKIFRNEVNCQCSTRKKSEVFLEHKNKNQIYVFCLDVIISRRYQCIILK